MILANGGTGINIFSGGDIVKKCTTQSTQKLLFYAEIVSLVLHVFQHIKNHFRWNGGILGATPTDTCALEPYKLN